MESCPGGVSGLAGQSSRDYLAFACSCRIVRELVATACSSQLVAMPSLADLHSRAADLRRRQAEVKAELKAAVAITKKQQELGQSIEHHGIITTLLLDEF